MRVYICYNVFMADLYKKLYDYRQKLRDRENKHTPTAVIADEPLKNLARLAPTTTDDMLKVTGIGRAFVNKYGVGFLNVILADRKPVKMKIMRSEVIETLKSLQSRLTNVNRRNRMLYLPKPVSGRAIDISSAFVGKASVSDVLLSSSAITLCDSESESYAEYNRLIRASVAAARETGTNTLYVGYPFAVGSCGKINTFNVAAPLALFPVTVENVNGRIVLSPDDSRDVTYNTALILCFNKFNERATALPSGAVEEPRKREFISDMLAFYAENGIEIKTDGAITPTKYFSYTEKTFPKYGKNEYELFGGAIVGMFPMYSGEIQRDFDSIIDSGVMPPTLTGLLEGADELEDFYGATADEAASDDGELSSEGDIDYISELNVSQERAVERADTELALVMQGPPGTGKSQTITSIISNEINKGRNVLVVSQKRAALSVIYSRLGRLSRYALFIDDPKDKNAFYRKLAAMLDAAESPAPFNNVAYKRTIDQVDADIGDLAEVAAALESEDYGAPMLDIYSENMDNPFKRAEREGAASASRAELFRSCVPEALLECGYDDLKAARDYLDDAELLETLGGYYSLADKYDWLTSMKPDMSDAKIAELMKQLDELLDKYAYGRFKFKFRKSLKEFLRENFKQYDKSLYKSLAKDPVRLYNGVKAYSDFYTSKITADRLDFCTRLYFGTLVNIAGETGEPYSALVGRLFDYCAYAFIDRFENERRQVFSHIGGFSTLVARICAEIDKKRLLARDKTMNALKVAFNANIADSKRKGEMLRAVDGKRRPSVAKFVEKFEFELFRGVRIFLMTPEAVSEVLPLKSDLFDLLVFDEASQIYVERGIPAIARARRFVVCGDHKQLRPSSLGDGRVTVDEDEENEAVLEEESLLDVARFKFPEVMLSYHYRSRFEELIAFSNAAFYGGKLNVSPDACVPSAPPITVHKVNGVWDDRRNVAEAEKVIALVEEHLKVGATLPQSARDTLGVITFNAKQRDLILDMIDKKCDADEEFRALYLAEYARREDGEDLGLFVKNIENVQGDERDRMIFSFAYAYNNKGVMSRNFGWLNRPGGENRLNVAISRAKKMIDIVVSIIPSDLKVDDINTEGVHVLRKYLDYAYCVSDGDADGAKRVLGSFAQKDEKTVAPTELVGLKKRVRDALAEKGYAVDANVGMGGYRIDLAVKNSRGEYVLGIECDDTALRSSSSARERDVMRRKFLTSRGWSMYRVWSSDFYSDPDGTIKDICGKIGM